MLAGSGSGAPAEHEEAPFDRDAMIELRRARNRWNDLSGDLGVPRAAADVAAGTDAEGSCDPIEIAVLDLPSYDAHEAALVRDRAAVADRGMRVAAMARRSASLLHLIESLKLADQQGHRLGGAQAGPGAAIDLRSDSITVIDLTDGGAAGGASAEALEIVEIFPISGTPEVDGTSGCPVAGASAGTPDRTQRGGLAGVALNGTQRPEPDQISGRPDLGHVPGKLESDEAVAMINRLCVLRDAGLLSVADFDAKMTELIGRL